MESWPAGFLSNRRELWLDSDGYRSRKRAALSRQGRAGGKDKNSVASRKRQDLDSSQNHIHP